MFSHLPSTNAKLQDDIGHWVDFSLNAMVNPRLANLHIASVCFYLNNGWPPIISPQPQHFNFNGWASPHPPSHHEPPVSRLFVAAVIPLICIPQGPRPYLLMSYLDYYIALICPVCFTQWMVWIIALHFGCKFASSVLQSQIWKDSPTKLLLSLT